jgi:hypothetical protein
MLGRRLPSILPRSSHAKHSSDAHPFGCRRAPARTAADHTPPVPRAAHAPPPRQSSAAARARPGGASLAHHGSSPGRAARVPAAGARGHFDSRSRTASSRSHGCRARRFSRSIPARGDDEPLPLCRPGDPATECTCSAQRHGVPEQALGALLDRFDLVVMVPRPRAEQLAAGPSEPSARCASGSRPVARGSASTHTDEGGRDLLSRAVGIAALRAGRHGRTCGANRAASRRRRRCCRSTSRRRLPATAEGLTA